MAFLTLQGVTWPISKDSAVPKIVEVGYMGRQIDGSISGTRRAVKNEWKLKTIPLNPVDALELQYTLLGLGNHWSFDSATGLLYSDKGLLNSAPEPAPTYTGVPTPKFGAGCIEILTGATTSLVGVAGYGPDGNNATTVTLIVWFYNGATWDGYALTDVNGTTTATVYKNGALLGSTMPGFITFNSTALSLNGKNFAGTNQNSFFDDLVVLPLLHGTCRPRDLVERGSPPFSPLPQRS